MAEDAVINKSNIVSLGSTAWVSSTSTGLLTKGSGTYYIYGPVARVYSFAKKAAFSSALYTYVSIYAYRNGGWVSIGSCNSVRGSSDHGATTNNWYYNYKEYSGMDAVFKVTYSISGEGSLAGASGQVTVYAGDLASSHANAYSDSTSPFYGKLIKGVNTSTGSSFDAGYTPSNNFRRGNKITNVSGDVVQLCTI